MIISNMISNCSNLLHMRNLQEQVEINQKNHSLTKNSNCSDLSLIEQIGLVIQKFCKYSAFTPKFQKIFSITKTFFSHSSSVQILLTKYHFFFLFKGIWPPFGCSEQYHVCGRELLICFPYISVRLSDISVGMIFPPA